MQNIKGFSRIDAHLSAQCQEMIINNALGLCLTGRKSTAKINRSNSHSDKTRMMKRESNASRQSEILSHLSPEDVLSK